MFKVMHTFLKPQKKVVVNVDLNEKTEVENIRTNFIHLCFGFEDTYEKFLRVIGKTPNEKTKYDYIYKDDENLRIGINKLLKKYSDKMKIFKIDPFPYDKYKFQLYFFDYIHKNKSEHKFLSSLLKNKNYFNKFIQELDKIFGNVHNIDFYEEIAANELMRIFDDFYFSLE